MTRVAKEEDLNHLSFLREISVLKEGEKTGFFNKQGDKKHLKTLSVEEDKTPQSPIQEKLSFLKIPFKPVLSEKLKKEVAEKFPTVSKNAKSDVSDLDVSDVSMDEDDKKKWDFSIPFLNKRKKVRVKYVSNHYTHIPVVEKEITSSHQIKDSRSLLVFSSSWVKTIFEDKILFKAIPATGTNLLVFPKGHYFFVQFAYQTTPIHPTQEMIHQKLSPLKVLVFRDFKSFRIWVYEQMRQIEGDGFKI